MPTSVYFNNYNSQAEQRVLEDLIVESIKIMGFDAYYLPNNNDEARDLLFGEDPVKKFKTAYPLELYLSNSVEYMGDKEFFSKFGLEIRNNVNVILSKRTFAQRVPQSLLTRPREGDLIYVPFLNGTGELYEIKYTNQTKDMFMLGRKMPFFYELELEKFKYSQEIIDTGVADIDEVVTNSAYTIDLNMAPGGTGNYKLKETVYQSADGSRDNATVVALVSSWANNESVLSVTNIAGVFVDGHTVYGTSSGAQHMILSFDPMDVNLHNEIYDNKYIQNSANGIVDVAETNSFGSL